jgi:3-oxoacyl-[acyl-carrier-protein] synthase-3
MPQAISVGIAGIGHFLPEEVITNAFFQESSGLSDEWILARTGIRERRRGGANETASTLGSQAARKALESANLKADEIDLIICTTISPDVPMPSTACFIQALIGAVNAVCFDLSAACSGFLYGLEVAEKMVRSGAYRNSLLISVDLMTRWVDYADAQTCPLFGDGAGAVVIKEVETGRGILGIKLYSNGDLANLVFISRKDPEGEAGRNVNSGKYKLQMDGKRTFKAAVQAMATASQNLLLSLGICTCEIDLIVPHQGNQRISDAVAGALEISQEKVFSNIERVGNTTSASIPIALDECVSKGKISSGSLVLLTAFGSGTTSGASVIRF